LIFRHLVRTNPDGPRINVWRRDFSNQPSFLSDVQGVLSKDQNTATLGLVWWWGRKEGSW
jgi:hypothetical protein